MASPFSSVCDQPSLRITAISSWKRARSYSYSRYMCFFFSSRRRHTRFDCDWSSDVCSSDLSRQDRREDADRGGLAGAVWTQEAEDAAGRDREVDAVERDDRSEPLLESFDSDEIGRASCRERV